MNVVFLRRWKNHGDIKKNRLTFAITIKKHIKVVLMKKNILLSIFLLPIIGSVVSAQSTVTTAGGHAKSNRCSVSYTVGQPVTRNVASQKTAVAEGVQQTYVIRTIGKDNLPTVVLDAIVYPNPTEDLVTLHIGGDFKIPENGLTANLYDGHGKLLQQIPVNGQLTELQIGHYAVGYYVLAVKQGSTTLKSFTISRKAR